MNNKDTKPGFIDSRELIIDKWYWIFQPDKVVCCAKLVFVDTTDDYQFMFEDYSEFFADFDDIFYGPIEVPILVKNKKEK